MEEGGGGTLVVDGWVDRRVDRFAFKMSTAATRRFSRQL